MARKPRGPLRFLVVLKRGEELRRYIVQAEDEKEAKAIARRMRSALKPKSGWIPWDITEAGNARLGEQVYSCRQGLAFMEG